MSAYATYITGRDALCNVQLWESTHQLFYRSNWRVLHIDGFEPEIEWTNVGKLRWTMTLHAAPGRVCREIA